MRPLSAILAEIQERRALFSPVIEEYRLVRDELYQEYHEAQWELFGPNPLPWNSQLDKVPCPGCGNRSKPSFFHPYLEGMVARYCPKRACSIKSFEVPVPDEQINDQEIVKEN